jgi:hypothetical protein
MGQKNRGLVSQMVEDFENRDILLRIERVRSEHRDLDDAIAALMAQGLPDQLQMARLKKRKLRLKDELLMLENQLVPDIIA